MHAKLKEAQEAKEKARPKRPPRRPSQPALPPAEVKEELADRARQNLRDRYVLLFALKCLPSTTVCPQQLFALN